MNIGWTQIANMALARISEQSISSINEKGAIQDRIRSIIDSVALEVLENHIWTSASNSVNLSALSEAPVGIWTAQYQLPNDFIKPIKVLEARVNRDSIEYSGVELRKWICQGDKLLVEFPDSFNHYNSTQIVGLTYVAYNESNINHWTPTLRDCISCLLASRLATNVSKNASLSDRLYREYRDKLDEARFNDVHRMGIDDHIYDMGEGTTKRYDIFGNIIG